MANLKDIIGKKVLGDTAVNDYDGPGTIVAFSVTSPNCVVVEWGSHWQGAGQSFNAAASVENIDDLIFI